MRNYATVLLRPNLSLRVQFSQLLFLWKGIATSMGLLPDTQNYGLRMRRECREGFPANDFKGNR